MLTTGLAILVLLTLSASLSGLETALFSLSPVERRRLKQSGGVSSLIAKTIEQPRDLLTTLLFGNELVNVAISILAGGIALELLNASDLRISFLVSIGITTLILLVFGEIVPKNVAVRYPLFVAQVLIVPYQLFRWIVIPLRLILSQVVDLFVGLAGGDPKKGRRMIVEEEFRSLLELGRQEGGLADLEQRLIQSALDFSNVPVSRIMTPREKIFAISVTTPIESLLQKIQENRFSRIPVFEGDLNHVIGILYAKDLLPWKISQTRPVREILKPLATVAPKDSLDAVFQQFRSHRIHIGIVQDSHGVVVGLVTMDDLLRRFFP